MRFSSPLSPLSSHIEHLLERREAGERAVGHGSLLEWKLREKETVRRARRRDEIDRWRVKLLVFVVIFVLLVPCFLVFQVPFSLSLFLSTLALLLLLPAKQHRPEVRV
jgi:hypothetical protein